jgi:type I restriction enzyme S subunit
MMQHQTTAMNTEPLLQHYERIAEGPDAVPRLRGFILDLAVGGKLVPQDPNDEPASELLKRIAKEKARLDRRKRIKNEPKSLNGDVEPRQLPNGWAAAPLADLVTVLNGRAYKQHELLSAGTPVLRVGNLFTSDKWYYSTLELDDDKYCEKGDLIFAWSASFGPFLWGGERVIYHYHIWKLPLHSEADLNKLYLYNFLLQKTREIKEAGHGISMIHMTKEKMEKLLVPLPPLAEQHRIVAKVDEFMGLCNRLEATREKREATRDRLTAASLARLNAPDPETFQADARFALDALPALTTRPDQIKRLRQTILNVAVRGKLVPQDSKDEPASELLKQIAKEKARLIKAGALKAERNPKVPSPTELFELPKGWSWTALQSVCLSISDGDHQPPPRSETGVPFIVIGDVRTKTINYDAERKVPHEYFNGLDPIRKPKAGDLLYTLVGSFGIPVPVLSDEPFCIQRHIGILRPSERIDLQALALFLESEVAYKQAEAAATGIAQKTVSLAGLRSMMLPLPPLAEQHRIVDKVDALMALCDQLEASLTATDHTRRRLLDALLAEALGPADARELEAAE